MRIQQYQVDAFANRVFEGNPAAVCPLDHWLEDRILQAIAEENNLAETAFFVPGQQGFRLRWFTPIREVALCGHATLASAHVLFNHLGHTGKSVTFDTRSGELTVEREDERMVMNFPSVPPRPCPPPSKLLEGLKATPLEVLSADDYIAVFENEAAIRAIAPSMTTLTELDLRGVVVTAPGQHADFVSRFFAPKYGIPEDPVTGSAHCELAPYWSSRLNKHSLAARQLSKRGGDVHCQISGQRVLLSGRAVTFLEATIELDALRAHLGQGAA
ncbi:PhzF family phenazine biosynthesis protein [Methylohalobius crimeensis]|uniref:PhzF family phenazine biosynthesis protein n=1 Tax=Methylohalobius crimeensis TaxID=244365 RepID=UPI0003B5A2D8|nr:PhzF family phenazine biosynthesis protein [Methylohalobius crimeensis]